jgi:H+/Cl- antiporter ClcA
MELLRAAQHIAWPAGPGYFLAAVERATAWQRVAVLTGAGLFAGVCRKMLRRPNNKGHAGDLSEAIWLRGAKIAVPQVLASAVVSIIIVGLGASLGREGALKQAGAAVAAQLSAWRRLSTEERRLLVACGAGAGMGAAYNVPFGGSLFVLEVLLGTLSLPKVLPALATSVIATAVSWIFLPDRQTYFISPFGAPRSLLFWSLLAGPLLGIASAGYIRLIAWADGHRPKGWRTIAAPSLVFAVLGSAAIWFPQLLGNGKDLVQQLLWGEIGPGLDWTLLVLKTLAIAGCLASGAPGGLFTPTMTCGALLGAALGQAWQLVWPGAPPGTFALIGGGAVLAASTQGPVSTIVLMVELTHRVDSMIVPLIVAVAGAMIATRALEQRSIYTARLLTDPDLAKGHCQDLQNAPQKHGRNP